MKNSKSTKKALFASILSLLLCFTMLIGTTFAWFTDTVTSANNIIMSGNLDVKLEYWDGDSWENVNGSSELFDKTALWEPGYADVVYLKVSNAGSLALKYKLGINIVSETVGKTVDGSPIHLSDYIYMQNVEGVSGETNAYKTREDAIAAAKDAKLISEGYFKAEELLPVDNDPATESEQYVALVVYMPEDTDNGANHNGTDLPKIELGVNLVATQLESEADGFGTDYDAGSDAAFVTTTASSEAELVEALAKAKNGDVIGIKGNVTWTTGAGIGSTPFVTDATYVTLYGVGDDATFTAVGSGVGAIGIDNGTVVFENLKIVDQSVSYAENSWEYGYLEFRGKTVFKNCDIANAIMMEGQNAKFVDCTFNSGADNEYAVWVSDGRASFEGCVFTGARAIKIHEAYGSEVDSVVIDGNKFLKLTKKPGVAIGDLNADTSVSIVNNAFADTQAGDQGLYSYESDTDVTTFNFVYENNDVDGIAATTTAELKAAANVKNATVYLAPGTYAAPKIAEGVTIIGEDGVIFNSTLSNTLNNVTIKNVHIKSANAQRWAYSRGTLLFEDCTFEATSVYAIHYDGLNGANITYKNCKIVGWVAIGGGAEHVTFDGCEISGNGSYGVIRLYSPGTIKNCVFDISEDNVNLNDVYQDGIHAVDCDIKVSGNVSVNGEMNALYNVSGTGKIVEE